MNSEYQTPPPPRSRPSFGGSVCVSSFCFWHQYGNVLKVSMTRKCHNHILQTKVSKGAKIRNRYNQVTEKKTHKEVPPCNGQQNILLEGLNQFNGDNHP